MSSTVWLSVCFLFHYATCSLKLLTTAANVACMEETRNIYRILVENLMRRHPSEDLSIHNIILEQILRKRGGEVRTGCIWLSKRTSGRVLCTR